MQTPGRAHGRGDKPLPAEGWQGRKASPARPHKDAAAPCQALDHRGDPFSVVREGVLAHAQPRAQECGAQTDAKSRGNEKVALQFPKVLQLDLPVPAYKEKMKELSMLSLICSCFYPEPRNINIYTYDGESPAAETPLATQWAAV
ncbi:hypothetical protein ACRRTK_021109 [Alexandromys fortis]